MEKAARAFEESASAAASATAAASGANSAEGPLLQLLRQHGRNAYHIEYGGYLSNHMQHGLVALHRLGAAPDTLARFAEAYSEHSIRGHGLEPPHREDDRPVQAAAAVQSEGNGDREGKAAGEIEKAEAIGSSCLEQLPSGSLAPWLGKRTNFLGLAKFFDQETERLAGTDNVLTVYEPQLLSGSFGAAFHPVRPVNAAIKRP